MTGPYVSLLMARRILEALNRRLTAVSAAPERSNIVVAPLVTKDTTSTSTNLLSLAYLRCPAPSRVAGISMNLTMWGNYSTRP